MPLLTRTRTQLPAEHRAIAAQGARFGLAGGLVAVVYLATTSLLAEVVGLDFQIALAIGFAVAIATHFALQREFVWAHEHGFAMPIHHQAFRYLLVAGVQYGLTALATRVLPGALHVATEVVYLTAVACLTVANFAVFRIGVFHPADAPQDET